jgi:hypothetical protein
MSGFERTRQNKVRVPDLYEFSLIVYSVPPTVR